MRQAQVVVYLSNAVDESIRSERAITTDSPAATNKVFAMAGAMRGVGMRCSVLSLGRGRQNGNGIKHAATARRLEHGVVLYAAFWQLPRLTHLVSSVSLAWLLTKLIRRHPDLCVLVYNRSYHYLLGLLLARMFGVRAYLDLEDGYNVEGRAVISSLKNALMRRLFGWLCPHGSIVANSGLVTQLDQLPAMVCHGIASDDKDPCQVWNAERLQVLFSGTLLEDVGAKLLLAALEILRRQYPDVVNKMHVVVTGKGPFADAFRNLAKQAPEWISFGDALGRAAYLDVLKSSHVGLSLRLADYQMGATTFPSKVVEYAQHGLLVLTTRASDVPTLFGETALYLDNETPEDLALLLASLPGRKTKLQAMSIEGRARVISTCSPAIVGRALKSLLVREKS